MTEAPTTITCPMCGNVVPAGQPSCSHCGEMFLGRWSPRRRANGWDTALAILFGLFALAVTGRALQLGYDLIHYHTTVGPRASEFDADLSTMEWITLMFDVGQGSLKRSIILSLWFWVLPALSLAVQSLRERFGAPPIPRRRVFWYAELTTIALTATLLMVTMIHHYQR